MEPHSGLVADRDSPQRPTSGPLSTDDERDALGCAFAFRREFAKELVGEADSNDSAAPRRAVVPASFGEGEWSTCGRLPRPWRLGSRQITVRVWRDYSKGEGDKII